MASKRALRRRQCGNKQRYGTEKEAMTAMMSLKVALGRTAYMQPYRCQFCRQFHFGHAPRRH